MDSGLFGPDRVLRFPPERWEFFEDFRTRATKSMPRWHPTPLWTDEQSPWSIDWRLLRHGGEGLAAVGLLHELVRLAFFSPRRGCLLGPAGAPLNHEEIALLIGQRPEDLGAPLERLQRRGWIESIAWPLDEAAAAAATPAKRSGRPAPAGGKLDEVLVALTDLPLGAQPRGVQEKIRDAIGKHSEQMVIDALAAALGRQGSDRTVAAALTRMAFESADRQKRIVNSRQQAPPASDAPDF